METPSPLLFPSLPAPPLPRRTGGQTDGREMEVATAVARTPAGHEELDSERGWNTHSLGSRRTDIGTHRYTNTV